MKQALLVIDFVEGIATRGTCANFLQKNPSVISNTNRLIAHFRAKSNLIIHVRLAFDPNYEGLPKNAPNKVALKENRKFLLGHPDTEFIPEMDVQEGDLVLNKKYGDPFYKSGLLDALHSIEELIFTGLATDNAILFGTSSAIAHDFATTVITDAVGASTQEAHESALTIMKGRVVNELISTDEFLLCFPL